MSNRQRRGFAHLNITISKDTCESGPVDMREFSSLVAAVPSAWTAAALGLKVSPVLDTTFLPLHIRTTHASGVTLLSQHHSVTASQAYIYSDEMLGGAGWVRFWSQAAGADVNQAAARVLGVSKKG